MKPDISEFSYGYALTSEVVQQYRMSLAGAPIFPSLIKEGTVGYDLELPIIGCPVFFQFKLSDYMIRSTAKGMEDVGLPHYRMHLRPLKYSKQHNLLLALEEKGNLVFYVAPEFHRPTELNDAYLRMEVFKRSAFFRPKAIGVLNDEEHFVCFSAGSSHGYRHSEPIRIERTSFGYIVNILSGQIVEEEAIELPARLYLRSLANSLVADWVQKSAEPSQNLAQIEKSGEKREPLEYLGWVAQTLYDCVVFVRLQHKAAR
jgi:hypothetical protein